MRFNQPSDARFDRLFNGSSREPIGACAHVTLFQTAFQVEPPKVDPAVCFAAAQADGDQRFGRADQREGGVFRGRGISWLS
jgi:hypothetical protein